MLNEMMFRARQREALVDHFDATETAFLERELTQLRAKVYEVEYATPMARMFIPKANDIAASATTYSYKVFEPVGMAKFITYKSDDIPRVDLVAREVLGKVHPIGAAYGWDLNELREAARLNLALSDAKARTARDVIERAIDQILATGSLPDYTGSSPDVNLTGLINNSFVVNLGIQAGGYYLGNSPPTPSVILSQLANLVTTIATYSDNRWEADTLLLPTAIFSFLQQSPFSTLTGESIMTIFRRNNPNLTTIAPWYKLNTAGASGAPRAIAYKKSPDVLEAIIPQEFEVMPPEMKGFEFLNNCHARCGGTKIYQPLAIRYLDFATS